MDYALLGIGIALLVALGWVVTALYDLKDRATYATDHMNAIQRQIAAIPTPDAPDLSALNAIHEKVSQPAPAPPDLSVLGDINQRLGLLDKLGEALTRKRDERVPAPVVARAVQRVESIKAGRKLLRERLAQRGR
jgi:hypothetical protein